MLGHVSNLFYFKIWLFYKKSNNNIWLVKIWTIVPIANTNHLEHYSLALWLSNFVFFFFFIFFGLFSC